MRGKRLPARMPRVCALVITCLLIVGHSFAQQIVQPATSATNTPAPNDEGYTAKIREYTTEKYFSTELVDHLPASANVPTPEKVLGYVVGAPAVNWTMSG